MAGMATKHVGCVRILDSSTWGRLQRKLINAWRADCPSLMNLQKGWLVEKGTVIWEHIYMGYGK